MLGQYLLKQLDELRDSHTMCDLTLVSRDGTCAHVHYLIFTAFNKRHFMVARKHQTALQEVGQRKVMPLNITSEELTIFVTFIYGKTFIQKSRYDLLVSVLRKLDMEHLLQECGGLTVKHEEPDIKMEQADSIDGTAVIDGPPNSTSIPEIAETTPDTGNIPILGHILSIDPTSNTSLNSSEDSEQNPFVTLKESKHDSEVIATMGIDSNFISEIKQEEFKVLQGLNVDPVIDTPLDLSENSKLVPLNVVFTSEDRGHSNITKTKRDKFMESTTTESTNFTDNNFYHSDQKNYITENVTSSFEGCCALDKDVFLKEETNYEKLTLELSDHNSAQKDTGVGCADRQNRSTNTIKTYAEIFSHLKCETLLPVDLDDNEKQMTKEKESASNQEASKLFSCTDSLKSSDKVIEINVSSSEKENLSTVKDNKNGAESQETFSLVVKVPGECSQCDKHLPNARQPAYNTGATTPVESEGVHLIAKSVITKLNNLIDTKGNQEITAKDINLAIPVSSLSQAVLANKSKVNDSVFGKNQSAFQIKSSGVFNDEQQATSGNQVTISSHSMQRSSSTYPSIEKSNSPGGSLLQQILQIPSMFPVNREQYKHIAPIPVTIAGLAASATKNQSLTVSPARHISTITKTPEMIHQNVDSKKTNPPFLEWKKTLIGASKQLQAKRNSEKDKNVDANELENTVQVSTASEPSSTELKLQNINIVAPPGTNSSEPNRLTSNYRPISIKGSPIPVSARIQRFKNIQFQLTQSAGTKVKNKDIQPKHENISDKAPNTSDEGSHALSHMSKKIAKLHVTIGRRQLLKRNILPHGFASKQVGLSSVYPSLSSLLTFVTPNDLQKGNSAGSSFESGKNRSENKVIYSEDICKKNFEDCNKTVRFKETSDANIETVDNHVFYKDIRDREPEDPVLSKDVSDLKCEVSEKDICEITIETSENSFHFVDIGELKCEESKGPVVSAQTKIKASELPVLSKDSGDTKHESSEIHVFSRGIREDTENMSKNTDNVICLEKNPPLRPSNIPGSEILKILSAPALYSCNSLPLNNKSTEAESVFSINTYQKNMVTGRTLCSTLVKLPEDCNSLANSEVATSPTLEKKHSYQTQSAVNHHTVAIKTPQTCIGTHKSRVMHPCQSKSKMSDCLIGKNSMLGNTESIVLLAACSTPTSVMTPLKIPETSSILSTTHKPLIPLFGSPSPSKMLPKTNTSKVKTKGSKRSKMSKSSPKNSKFHKSVASTASSLPIQLITGPIQLPVTKASPLRKFIIIPPISSPSPGLLPTIMSGQNRSLYLPPVSCPSRMPIMANASSLLLDTSTALKQTSPCGSRHLKPLQPKPLFTLPVNTNFSSGGPITLIPYTANLTSTTPSHTIRNAVLEQNAPVIPLKFDASTHIPTGKNEETAKRYVNVEENPDIGGLASVDLPGIQIANYSESDDASDPVAELAAKLNTDHLQCNYGKAKVNKENVCSVVQGKRKARFCTANATKKIKTRPLASRTGPVTTSYQKTDQTAQISPASEHGNCIAACCENNRGGSEKNENSMESNESFCNKFSAYYDSKCLCHHNIDGAIDLSEDNNFSEDDLPLSHLARKRHKTDSDIPGQNQDKPAAVPANVNIKHLVSAMSSLPSPQLLVTHLTSEKKVPRKVKMSRRRNTALWSCKLKTMIMKGNNDK